MSSRVFFTLSSIGSVVSMVGLLVACSSDSPADTASPDAAAEAAPLDASGSTDAAAEASPVDAGTDSADAATTTTFKGCTDAELAAAPLFANGADISFFTAGVDGGALAYANSCVRIPKGKDVGWYGDFTAHPLSNNGEPGSPIPHVTTGNDSGRIAFPTAGKYSFHCDIHPSTMFGTVLVEP